MASLRAPSSKPAPGTSEPGSNLRECFQNSSQHSPRRPLHPLRSRPERGGLTAVWWLPGFTNSKPNTKALRPLPVRALAQPQWAAVPDGRGIRAGDAGCTRPESRNARPGDCRVLFLPNGSRGYRICLLNDSAATKYQNRAAAADIAFCVAACANGMIEERIERALEDDHLSRDPSASKRADYIRRTMEKARRWAER